MNLLKKLFIGDFESYADEKSYRVFFIQNIFLILGTIIHIMYISVFLTFKIRPMVYIELLSVVLLIIAVIINRNKVKYVPAFFMCLEIGINGVLWALVMPSGYGHYLYGLVALLAIFLFLELKRSHKVFLTVFLLICSNIAHYAEYSFESIILQADKEWLAALSFNIVFIILTMELTINEITSQAIKKMHKETLNKIQKMSKEILLDPLTKAYNRRFFQENEETIDKNAAESDCCAVILDIDHFKKINDTYGHDVGDKVLIFFADKMKSEFRASDIIMRWGGEEFVILLNNTSLENAVKKLDKFRSIIQKSAIKVGKDIIKFTFTAGVCKVLPGLSVSEAITQADSYLYEGKNGGRNRIVYR